MWIAPSNLSAKMPSSTVFTPVSPVDSKKRPDYFQRRKVGSIRDNPKLLKIRQQFESACQDPVRSPTSPPNAESAPSSFSLSRKTSSVVLDELLKSNRKFSDKTDSASKSQIGSSQVRRNSEGDIKKKPLSVASYENSLSSCSSVYLNYKENSAFSLSLSSFSNSLLPSKSGSFVTSPTSPCDSLSEKFASQNVSSESGVHTNSSLSDEDSISTHFRLKTPEVNEDANKFFRDVAPPIPRRGISPAVQNSLILSRLSPDEKTHSPAKRQDSDGNSSVKKAIQMYEGMSSSELRKAKLSKTSLKRDDSTSRRSFLLRRHSRRSSFRKSKHLNEKEFIVLSPNKRKDVQYKDDSGVSLSDGEDRTQSIYQTLTTTVNLSPEQFDPYDRLNRLHDAANRIHKGQPSNCAACKAIPSSVLQYRTSEDSIMQVKCNELAPHHHPPCICFACQHSIFSCAEGPAFPSIDEDRDSLYYNVCCLNSPNREHWRQSRRRPVCEQNGRLCIVNCDMERGPVSCMVAKESEDVYAKLSDCHSVTNDVSPLRNSSKHVGADSCDSDEGWVDVTDSEDEKSLTIDKSCNRIDATVRSPVENFLPPNDLYDLDCLVAKMDISRATSTEHLYESISDMAALVNECIEKEHISNTSQDSTSSLKDEQNPENELDSGEWSTESASPTFDESASHNNLEQRDSSTSNQYRFMVNSEAQETAKKTFMKSVLGKKAVAPKKRRMSNFFVPWLVSNSEYAATSKSPKTSLKKQGSRSQMTSVKSSQGKSKRSHSAQTNSHKLNLSCTKTISSSSELLDECNENTLYEEHRNKCSDGNSFLNPADPLNSVSSRGSIASSTYVRSDQLQSTEQSRSKNVAPTEAPVEVSVERVRKRSPSGNSERSYILFQPVKEEDVPLYQFYERNIKERVSFCRSPNSLSPVMWSSVAENCSHDYSSSRIAAAPQLSVVEQLSPEAQDMKMLWCELPEVKESGILERISAQELKLQEAIFEFIQSQASYIRSLKVLYENFIRTSEFSDFESSSCVLSKHEHDVLFLDIIRVKEVSERLLSELTARWSDGILIPDICDIIHRHAVLPSFSVYVRYCSNRVYQERTLKELKETRLCFLEILRKLESNPVCQGLSLESFLFLPMQHIARLPLLLDNIFRWSSPESPTHGICQSALASVHKVFVECNEGARRMERLEEMFVLNRQLEFKDCKVVPLISASRWLLKKGELVKLEFDKKTFGRSSRCVRVPIYIFLFNDLLVVTKRKNCDCYFVVDYCSREKVQAIPINAKDLQQPVVVPNSCRYLISLSLNNNHQGSAVDMILSCALLSERTRWIEAISCVPANKPCEVWEYDCPQVQCVRTYIAQQPDELSLQESDIVTVHRKMNDGWYEGRRLRDGLQGWFPASYTMDIPCSRARASNLKQCYRLLMLSQSQ